MAAQVHHFGWFIRSRRQTKKLAIRRVAEAAGISEKRLWQIEQKETPDIYGDTFGGIAKALGYASAEELDKAWREETVAAKPPKKREGLVYLPPDLVESLKKMRVKDVSLTDLAVSILREWTKANALQQAANPASGSQQSTVPRRGAQRSILMRGAQGKTQREVGDLRGEDEEKQKNHGDPSAAH